jgi:hypothetical protein
MTSVVDVEPELGSVGDGCRRLGEILGLEGPVPEPVFHAAVHDAAYARNLLTCRRAPALLRHLLDNPPAVEPDSAMALLRRASQALVGWSRTGFTTVDEATYERRVTACLRCPHLMEADRHRRMYRAVTGSDRPKVCGLCGCAVAQKARRTSERCPGEDPEHPDLNRWGEPRRPDAHATRHATEVIA